VNRGRDGSFKTIERKVSLSDSAEAKIVRGVVRKFEAVVVGLFCVGLARTFQALFCWISLAHRWLGTLSFLLLDFWSEWVVPLLSCTGFCLAVAGFGLSSVGIGL
jgi:hypothetical protein